MKHIALVTSVLIVCITAAMLVLFRYEPYQQHPEVRFDRWYGRVELVEIEESAEAKHARLAEEQKKAAEKSPDLFKRFGVAPQSEGFVEFKGKLDEENSVPPAR